MGVYTTWLSGGRPAAIVAPPELPHATAALIWVPLTFLTRGLRRDDWSRGGEQ